MLSIEPGTSRRRPRRLKTARCALRWITNHAREYSLDPAKFVLTGTSAGGHLSLITGMLPANTVFDRQCTVDGGGRWNTATVPELKVAAIVNWFGIGDVADLLEGPNAKNYAREWFGSMSNAEAACETTFAGQLRARGFAADHYDTW